MSTADIADQRPLGARVCLLFDNGDQIHGMVERVDPRYYQVSIRTEMIRCQSGSATFHLSLVGGVIPVPRPEDAPSTPSPPPDAPFAAWAAQHPGVETELVRGPSSSSRDAAFEREKADMLGRRD